MFQLTELPKWYETTHGREKIAEVLGVTENVVAMKLSKDNFPLDWLQKLLEFDPAPLGSIRPLYETPKLDKKLMILVPCTTAPQPKMMDSLMRLYNPAEMSYERMGFNCPSVVRNNLAARFLNSPSEWAFWMDADSLLPAGDAGWFKREAELPQMPDVFAGLHTIYRLLAHKLKRNVDARIVSVCYVSRRKGAVPQFGGGELPDIRLKVKNGPRDELTEAPWCGFGGVLTHRSVFDDIIRTQGNEIRMKPNGVGGRFHYQYAFFDPIDREVPGDDLPFCIRARNAGHKVYVDLALMGAHVGDRPYSYVDI